MKKKIYFLIIMIFFVIVFSLILRYKERTFFIERIVKDIGFSLVSVLAKEKDFEVSNSMIETENLNLKKEILELKDLLELDSLTSDYNRINATVINRNMQYFYDSVILNKGKNDGVKLDMPVITSGGLLGKITKVTNNTSTVKLITNSDIYSMLSVQIKTSSKYVYGVLTGYDAKTNSFIIEGIDEMVKINAGDIVSTTGLGNTYISGIMIGKVVRIGKDNFDLAYILKVEPSANFEVFHYVSILEVK